jgi:hypothetical protein
MSLDAVTIVKTNTLFFLSVSIEVMIQGVHAPINGNYTNTHELYRILGKNSNSHEYP